MGARTPANVKEKRAVFTCEVCQREFLNVQSLKSHTIAKHPNDKHTKSNEPENKDEKKTAFVPPTSRVSRRLLQKKSVENEPASEDSSSSSITDRRKAVFECPLCSKLFPVYFSAQRHIKKYHDQNEDGNHGSSDLLVVKPLRKEMCTMCDKLVHGTVHKCRDFSLGLGEPHDNGMYSCLGCKKNFVSIDAFDDHVAGAHNEHVDILIFENLNEFLVWKKKIESQAHVKYLTLSNTTQRQYYQCNYVSPKNSADITHLCPSVMVIREFSKVFHVRFYKDHFGHKNSNQPMNNDEVFNSLLQKDVENDDDLYIKFKNLLQSISIGAAKVNVSKLKKLYNAALEMQTCLNRIEETQKIGKKMKSRAISNNQDSAEIKSSDNINNDNIEETTTESSTHKSHMKETDKTNNKNIDDDQITKALQAPRASARLKRKSISSPAPVAKKQKPDADKNASETKPSSDEISSKTKDIKFDSPKVTKVPLVNESPSFNDSYKQFIDSTLKTNTDSKDSSPSIKKVAKKSIVKTKMGQFSPKKIGPMQDNSENVANMGKKKKTSIKSPQSKTSDIKQNQIVQNSEKITNKTINAGHVEIVDITKKKVPVKSPQSPATLNLQHILQSPKSTVQMNITSEPIAKIHKKRKIAPTKLSQTSIIDINLEQIEYEVVEQENDCNILVLKI